MKKLEFLFIFVVWVLFSIYKISIYQKGTNFLKSDEFGLFRVEEATRYRYAKLIAEGKKIPEIDYRIQYPEGLDVKKHFTTTSQYILGYTYRFLGLKKFFPFHVWVIIFMFFYSSLIVFPVYYISRTYSKILPSIIGTLFYVTSFASYSRTVAGGLVEEDIALFPMFLTLYLFILHYQKKRKKLFPFITVLTVYFLSGWHVSQFFYFIFLVFVIFYYFLFDRNILSAFIPIFIGSFIAGFIVPVMRGEKFLFSYSMLLSYSFLISTKIKKFKIPVMLILFLISMFLTNPVLKKHSKNYSHVYTLIINKIKYFGIKPKFSKEAEKIPFDAKVLWQGSFVSPKLKEIKKHFSYTLIALVPAILFLILNPADRFIILMLIFFNVSFFSLYLLIRRLYVFSIFFFSLLIPFAFNQKNKKLLYITYLSLIPLIPLNLKHSYKLTQPVARRINSYKMDLIKWMNKHLPENSVILSNIGIAPEIVQNSKFKTVLHNHYESYDIREKTKEFYEKIFEDEKTFYKFCKKYKSNYLIYHWEFIIDSSVNSIRYQVNRIYVSKNSAAFLFHFYPEKLKYFKLIYQNNYYRLFAIKPYFHLPPSFHLKYVPFYNPKLFINPRKEIYLEDEKTKGKTPVLDDDYATKKMKEVWKLPQLRNRLFNFIQHNNINQAEKILKELLNIDPYSPFIMMDAADFYYRAGKTGLSKFYLKKTIKNYPDHFYQTYILLAKIFLEDGNKTNAIKVLNYGKKYFPENNQINEFLNYLKNG